jgi:hypothetical protein
VVVQCAITIPGVPSPLATGEALPSPATQSSSVALSSLSAPSPKPARTSNQIDSNQTPPPYQHLPLDSPDAPIPALPQPAQSNQPTQHGTYDAQLAQLAQTHQSITSPPPNFRSRRSNPLTAAAGDDCFCSGGGGCVCTNANASRHYVGTFLTLCFCIYCSHFIKMLNKWLIFQAGIAAHPIWSFIPFRNCFSDFISWNSSSWH